jgi:hypothetical protein
MVNDLFHHRGHRFHREESQSKGTQAVLSVAQRPLNLKLRSDSWFLDPDQSPPRKHPPEQPCLLFRDKQPAFPANAGLFVFYGQEFSGIAAEKVPESCHRGEPVVSLESPNPSIQMLIASSHTDRDAPTNRFSETNHAQRIRSPV